MRKKSKLAILVFPRFNFKKNLLVAALALFIFFLYNTVYFNRIFPNVYLADAKLSGKSREGASLLILEKIQSFATLGLTFRLAENEIIVNPEDLGINFDRGITIQKAFNLGRSGKLGDDLIFRMKAPFVKVQIEPVYTINFNEFALGLEEKFAKYEQRPANATINLADGKPQIQDGEKGTIIDNSALILAIRRGVKNLSSDPIEVFQIEQLPLIDKSGAQKALGKVESLNRTQLALIFESNRWTISDQALFKLLKFYPKGFEGEYLMKLTLGDKPIYLRSLKYADSPEPILDVRLDENALDLFIDKIATSIDRPKTDAHLRFENGRVEEFTPAYDGQALDKLLTKKLILEKISIDNINSERQISINLPVNVTRAKIDNAQINSLGIRELLGRGVSYFAGSIANRVHNIGLGTSRVSGVLVAPGEVFSFNRTVGEVSAASGYRQAYVISQGRTILDDGGGICQVSTTVFRAALNSGLPIVSRTAHAYRVAYYEQAGFKPGFDATVWAPTVDLVFKNDAKFHILIQAIVDPANSKLQVDIYGTADGRKTTISDPVITNKTPPPPDKYEDDPTLPKGMVKQVDFAASGATVVFSRKVERGSDVLINETFKSNYRPWQAVYLVGTGT